MKLNKLKTFTTVELEELLKDLLQKGVVNSLVSPEDLFDFVVAGVAGELSERERESNEEKQCQEIEELEDEIQEANETIENWEDAERDIRKELRDLKRKLDNDKVLSADIYDLIATIEDKLSING